MLITGLSGNSWGLCEDGTDDVGCGDQEIFRSCADITIVEGDGSSSDDESEENHSEEGEDTSEEDGLQPCILQGIFYPLNVHDPRSRMNEM